MEIIESEEQKDKRLKKIEQSLRDLWDTIKWTNEHVGISEGKQRGRRGHRNYLK